MKNTAFEMHDSTLGSIAKQGTGLIIRLPQASVFTSDAEPGLDPGIVCTQALEIALAGAEMRSAPTELPVVISDGRLKIGDRLIENMIPIPFTGEGDVELSLQLVSGENLVIVGTRIEFSLLGEGRGHYEWS
jgi:hypothetical protein